MTKSTIKTLSSLTAAMGLDPIEVALKLVEAEAAQKKAKKAERKAERAALYTYPIDAAILDMARPMLAKLKEAGAPGSEYDKLANMFGLPGLDGKGLRAGWAFGQAIRAGKTSSEYIAMLRLPKKAVNLIKASA